MTKQPVGSVQDDGSLQVEPCRFRHQGEQLVVRQGDVDLGEVAHGVHGSHRLRYQHPGAVVHRTSRFARGAHERRLAVAVYLSLIHI